MCDVVVMGYRWSHCLVEDHTVTIRKRFQADAAGIINKLMILANVRNNQLPRQCFTLQEHPGEKAWDKAREPWNYHGWPMIPMLPMLWLSIRSEGEAWKAWD